MSEHAQSMEVITVNGQRWVSADSLADLFAGMAEATKDGPSGATVRRLADAFYQMSSYAELSATTAKPIVARRCGCGAAVIDSKRVNGDPIIVNAEPSVDGELVPTDTFAGDLVMAPWSASGFDGVSVVRLAEHRCQS